MPEKIYYSKHKYLVFPAGPSQRIIQNGMAVTLDAPEIAFSPVGSVDNPDGWGQFNTSDPVKIEACERRIKEQGDIFGPEEFNKRLKPAGERMVDAEAGLASMTAENQRLIEANNRLAAMLQDKGALPRATK